MKTNSFSKLTLATFLALALAASATAGTFKRITIDGSFADWAGVPLAYSDASETTAGADFRLSDERIHHRNPANDQPYPLAQSNHPAVRV